MKNRIDDGTQLKFTAPSGGATSGVGYIIGDTFVIANFDAAEGEECIGEITGTYDLPAVSGDTGTEGTLVYWDDSGKEVTLTASTHKIVGVYAEDKINAQVLVRVRLNGIILA